MSISKKRAYQSHGQEFKAEAVAVGLQRTGSSGLVGYSVFVEVTAGASAEQKPVERG